MNIVEFALKMKDMFSPDLKRFGETSRRTFDTAITQTRKLESENVRLGQSYDTLKAKASGFGSFFSTLKGMAATAGIGFGFYQIGTMMGQGVERAHGLHVAEAQLKNTMQNMGNYSDAGFEKVIADSKSMAKGINYSTADIVSLQSQLRMLGNIGDKEMSRLTMASADMSAKFGLGLEESGNAIAKAVNNPEMLRRLGMQLKIDPHVQEHLQNLAKHGHEAQARLELLNIIERKVGGAAKVAFDADPLARYNKVVGSIKMELGEFAITMQKYIGPVLEFAGKKFKELFGFVKMLWGEFKKGNPWLVAIAGVFVSITAAIVAYNTVMLIAAGITGLVNVWKNIMIAYEIVVWSVKNATTFWAGAQFLLNTALTLNPVGVVIAAIVALIAIIALVIYKVDGWGKTWHNLIEFMKLATQGFVLFFQLQWLAWKNLFLSGLEEIEKGWYKLQGLWNSKSANSALEYIKNERNARIEEMKGLTKEAGKVANQMSTMTIWELKSNDKKPLDLIKKFKGALGIQDANSGLIGNNRNNNNVIGGSSTSNEKSITSGGPKIINISVGKFLDSINIHANTITESTNEMEQKILEMFSRVLAQGAPTAQ